MPRKIKCDLINLKILQSNVNVLSLKDFIPLFKNIIHLEPSVLEIK